MGIDWAFSAGAVAQLRLHRYIVQPGPASHEARVYRGTGAPDVVLSEVLGARQPFMLRNEREEHLSFGLEDRQC